MSRELVGEELAKREFGNQRCSRIYSTFSNSSFQQKSNIQNYPQKKFVLNKIEKAARLIAAFSFWFKFSTFYLLIKTRMV